MTRSKPGAIRTTGRFLNVISKNRRIRHRICSVVWHNNLTSEHQTINVAGMSGNPAEYTSAIIANSSIVALINEDVIRPLDDLVAMYGQDIPARQLITIDGKVMAVAFMANAQHLVYRKDVLDQVGLDVPSSYEEVLAAAEAIRAAGIMENPVGGAYAAGWNLAEEFVNMLAIAVFRRPHCGGMAGQSPRTSATQKPLQRSKRLHTQHHQHC